MSAYMVMFAAAPRDGFIPEVAATLQAPASSQAPSQTTSPAAPDGVMKAAPKNPWCVELGLRVAGVEAKIPTLDRVVLVKDEASFLDEISHWRLEARWPVLIEDDIFTPQFIRAFKPAQVLRRVEKAPNVDDPAVLQAAIENAVSKAWNAAAPNTPALAAITAQTYTPPGVAIMDSSDPAWVAGVALAAGHGLVPVFIQGNFGGANDVLAADQFDKLSKAVDQCFVSTGLSYGQLGDALEGAVLCKTTAQKTIIDVSAALRPSARGMPAINPADPVAVTDALCRNTDGSRYAFCGAIFGTSKYCAYAAMSSLFLSRNSIGAFNSYQSTDFAKYGFAEWSQKLPEAGYTTKIWSGTTAHIMDWRQMLSHGFESDVLFLNSSGNSDFFELGSPGKTPIQERAAPGDVPILSKPLVLHMIHSWSLTSPMSHASIGGRWLESGVYAYVGSVQEPYLPAFSPPAEIMSRCANFVPYLIASRVWEGPFAMPWRVATLGDPFMLIQAPKSFTLSARKAPPPPVPGQEDVLVNCKKLLTQSKEDKEGTASIAALRELIQRGEDKIAAQFWLSCSAKSFAPRMAPLALEPLYRQRNADQFLTAYCMVADPTPRANDMLWQLWGEQLIQIKDPDTILLFVKAVRSPQEINDWRRLMPALGRLAGPDSAHNMLLKAAAKVDDSNQKKMLQELANQS